MFQEMINGSIAVFTKPSVETFETHEKDNLTWALIDSVIAGVINAVLGAIKAALFPGAVEGFQSSATGGSGIVSTVVGAVIATIIGMMISWGITYGLGKAFGGTGKFGELAYDLSLFNAPSTVIFSVLNFIPILGGIAALVLGCYNMYLTYVGIQSGMNLPSNKALYVILIEIAIVVVLGICVGVFAFAAIAALMGASGGLER